MAACFQNDCETELEKCDRDEATKSTLAEAICLDSLPDVSTERQLSTTISHERKHVTDLDNEGPGQDCHGENSRLDWTALSVLTSLGFYGNNHQP